MKNKIDQETTLKIILEYPGSDKVLGKYNVPCLTCPFAQMEMNELKIGDICKNYSIDSEKLISELNKLNK